MVKNRGLPDSPRHHVYRFFDETGRLLYVGATYNLPQRLAKHRARHWFRHVRRQEVTTYPERRAAFAAEREAIRSEKPLHNLT